MTSKQTALRIPLAGLACLIDLFLAGCTSDAQRMRQLQLEMAPFRNGDVKGSGSLRVNLSGMCLHSKMPPGEGQLDLFLQTSEQEGFFVMAKNLDMREVLAEEGRNMDELPDCPE